MLLQFVWYHYQDKVRRSTFGNKSRRMVGGHIATKANESDLNEHKSDVQEQWDVIAKEVRLLLRTTASAKKFEASKPRCSLLTRFRTSSGDRTPSKSKAAVTPRRYASCNSAS